MGNELHELPLESERWTHETQQLHKREREIPEVARRFDDSDVKRLVLHHLPRIHALAHERK
jgi:hypothetical protein